MIDLQIFCSDDDGRESIRKPWSRGEYSYATNGHIVVRVPRIAEIPENSEAPDAETRIFAKNPLKSDDIETPIPPLPPAITFTCPDCAGSGKSGKCPECEGSGEVCWTSPAPYCHEYEADCVTCHGYGKVTGTETCDLCGGTGYRTKRFGVKIGETWFDRDYLAKISSLPGLKLYARYPGATIATAIPSVFIFDGGIGMIMPRLGE